MQEERLVAEKTRQDGSCQRDRRGAGKRCQNESVAPLTRTRSYASNLSQARSKVRACHDVLLTVRQHRGRQPAVIYSPHRSTFKRVSVSLAAAARYITSSNSAKGWILPTPLVSRRQLCHAKRFLSDILPSHARCNSTTRMMRARGWWYQPSLYIVRSAGALIRHGQTLAT